MTFSKFNELDLNREFGKSLKLFLGSGSNCESVIWRRKRRRRRRRTIHEIKKQVLKSIYVAVSWEIYY
jgi:hypothetical protein